VHNKRLLTYIFNFHPEWVDGMVATVCTTMTLALPAKAISVSAPSDWNSLSYNCRSAETAESFSSFRRDLKTELFDTAYSEPKHSA